MWVKYNHLIINIAAALETVTFTFSKTTYGNTFILVFDIYS
jgi:hypothetical protein